jgi:signal transduction histidine kinase
MIRDLLDASRLRAGEELNIEFEECDLDWILRQVADEVNFTVNDKVFIRSQGSCIGNWNADALRRIVENLTSNAVKYGRENSKITLLLDQDDTTARFTVHNEGKPIPPEEKAILFQQFKRSRSHESLKTGWGIGLTVVQGLVDAHGGTITVESEEGKGTSFIISLPKNPKL